MHEWTKVSGKQILTSAIHQRKNTSHHLMTVALSQDDQRHSTELRKRKFLLFH